MYIFISHMANILVMSLKMIIKLLSFMVPRYCSVLLFLTATPNTRQLYSKSSPVWPVQKLMMMPALWLPEPPLPVRKRPLLHKLCTAIRSISRETFSYPGDSFQHHTACQLLTLMDQCPLSASLNSSSSGTKRWFPIVISHEMNSIITVYAKM